VKLIENSHVINLTSKRNSAPPRLNKESKWRDGKRRLKCKFAPKASSSISVNHAESLNQVSVNVALSSSSLTASQHGHQSK
jgi:hypothetical protein